MYNNQIQYHDRSPIVFEIYSFWDPKILSYSGFVSGKWWFFIGAVILKLRPVTIFYP